MTLAIPITVPTTRNHGGWVYEDYGSNKYFAIHLKLPNGYGITPFIPKICTIRYQLVTSLLPNSTRDAVDSRIFSKDISTFPSLD